MKTSILFIAVVVICSASFAAVESVTAPDTGIRAGWNLISLPAFPCFEGGNAPGYPPDMFDELVGDGTGLDNKLTRWDAYQQRTLAWNSASAQAKADFGSLLVGDGYWLWVNPAASLPITYPGITDNDSIDIFVSLPKAGWNLIGYPYSTPVPIEGNPYYSGDPYLWANVKVTDGLTTKSLYDASCYSAGWIYSLVYWYDCTRKGTRFLGLPDDDTNCESMIAWHGYWVRTLKDNLGLIFEAPNS